MLNFEVNSCEKPCIKVCFNPYLRFEVTILDEKAVILVQSIVEACNRIIARHEYVPSTKLYQEASNHATEMPEERGIRDGEINGKHIQPRHQLLIKSAQVKEVEVRVPNKREY